MACSAVQLAKYTVDFCTADGEPVSNLQLQKMLYFMQSVYCRASNGDLLFEDEFEAWPYGPVLPEVYELFATYGGRPIRQRFEVVLPVSGAVSRFIDDGIRLLRQKSPWDLVKTSHAPGSP